MPRTISDHQPSVAPTISGGRTTQWPLSAASQAAGGRSPTPGALAPGHDAK